MPIDTAIIHGLWPIVRKIPAFLVRWYFTRERLAQLIYVDLYPRNESARINLGAAPSVNLHIQVINLSPFTIELDRATFRLWCGGITLDSSLLKRQSISSGEIASLFLETALSEGQATQLAKNFENNQVALDGNIEFNCKVRAFPRVIHQLSGVQAKLINAHLRNGDA